MFFGGMWILWIFIVVGLALFVKGTFLKREEGEIGIQSDDVDILKQRYVRGEIDRKEFKKIMNDLR